MDTKKAEGGKSRPGDEKLKILGKRKTSLFRYFFIPHLPETGGDQSESAMDAPIIVQSSEDAMKRTSQADHKPSDGIKDIGLLPKITILDKWNKAISDSQLEFADGDTTAKRPGGASNYPASLVAIPPGEPGKSISFTAVLTAAPPRSYAMSFGIARCGFKMNHSSGFGDSPGSWGIAEVNRSGNGGGCISSFGGSSKEQKTTFRKMKVGDVFCLRYERVLGRAWLYINKTELVQEFKIHEPGESPDLVVGATYCADHVLKIIAEPPPDLDALPQSARLSPTASGPRKEETSLYGAKSAAKSDRGMTIWADVESDEDEDEGSGIVDPVAEDAADADDEDDEGFVGTILEKWDRSISDPALKYTDDDTTAKRPGGVSNYPASLIRLQPTANRSDGAEAAAVGGSVGGRAGSFSLTAVLTAAPPNSYAMSFGIAKLGFKMNHSSGFGETKGSWGLNEVRATSCSEGRIYAYDQGSRESLGTFRKMKVGDVFCLRYERVLGRAWLYINKTELVQEFKIHEPGESPDLVVGATYCADHMLKIIAEPPPDLPAEAKDELRAALEDTKITSGVNEAAVAAGGTSGTGEKNPAVVRKKLMSAPLLTATLEGNLEEVTALVAAGEDVNAADKQGWTPLGNAARKGYVEIIRLLLEAAADVSKKNINGWTPIFAAARNGRVAAVKVLLEAGAVLDPSTKIVFNKEVATSEQQAQVHELLYSMRFEVPLHCCAAQFRSWWRTQREAHEPTPKTEMVVEKLQGFQPRDAVFVFVSGTFDQSLLMDRAARQIAQHAAVLLQLASSEELQRHLIASFGWLLSVKYPHAEGRFSVVLKALYDESLVDEEALQDWYYAARRDERSALSLIPASSLEALLQSAAPLLAWLQEAEEEEEEVAS